MSRINDAIKFAIMFLIVFVAITIFWIVTAWDVRIINWFFGLF